MKEKKTGLELEIVVDLDEVQVIEEEELEKGKPKVSVSYLSTEPQRYLYIEEKEGEFEKYDIKDLYIYICNQTKESLEEQVYLDTGCRKYIKLKRYKLLQKVGELTDSFMYVLKVCEELELNLSEKQTLKEIIEKSRNLEKGLGGVYENYESGRTVEVTLKDIEVKIRDIYKEGI